MTGVIFAFGLRVRITRSDYAFGSDDAFGLVAASYAAIDPRKSGSIQRRIGYNVFMIEITTQPIDTAAVLHSVSSPNCGASLLFVGTTRKFTGSKQTTRLAYECYQEMAIKKLAELKTRAMEKWPLEKCSIVHRIGVVAVEEASIAVAVSSPHRVDSFSASQWLMDTLKKEVPIWKQEHWADGSQEWIHDVPGQPSPPA